MLGDRERSSNDIFGKKVLDLLSWFGPIRVFLLVRCSSTGWLLLDPHFLLFVWVWNDCPFQVLQSVSSGKLLFCCCCALDCNGFWRLWLDSHGLWVIAMILKEDWEEEKTALIFGC